MLLPGTILICVALIGFLAKKQTAASRHAVNFFIFSSFVLIRFGGGADCASSK